MAVFVQLIPVCLAVNRADCVSTIMGFLQDVARIWPVGHVLIAKAHRRIQYYGGGAMPVPALAPPPHPAAAAASQHYQQPPHGSTFGSGAVLPQQQWQQQQPSHYTRADDGATRPGQWLDGAGMPADARGPREHHDDGDVRMGGGRAHREPQDGYPPAGAASSGGMDGHPLAAGPRRGGGAVGRPSGTVRGSSAASGSTASSAASDASALASAAATLTRVRSQNNLTLDDDRHTALVGERQKHNLTPLDKLAEVTGTFAEPVDVDEDEDDEVGMAGRAGGGLRSATTLTGPGTSAGSGLMASSGGSLAASPATSALGVSRAFSGGALQLGAPALSPTLMMHGLLPSDNGLPRIPVPHAIRPPHAPTEPFTVGHGDDPASAAAWSAAQARVMAQQNSSGAAAGSGTKTVSFYVGTGMGVQQRAMAPSAPGGTGSAAGGAPGSVLNTSMMVGGGAGGLLSPLLAPGAAGGSSGSAEFMAGAFPVTTAATGQSLASTSNVPLMPTPFLGPAETLVAAAGAAAGSAAGSGSGVAGSSSSATAGAAAAPPAALDLSVGMHGLSMPPSLIDDAGFDFLDGFDVLSSPPLLPTTTNLGLNHTLLPSPGSSAPRSLAMMAPVLSASPSDPAVALGGRPGAAPSAVSGPSSSLTPALTGTGGPRAVFGVESAADFGTFSLGSAAAAAGSGVAGGSGRGQ